LVNHQILYAFPGAALVALSGCFPKPPQSNEEVATKICLEQLDNRLSLYAKYQGWDTRGAKTLVDKFEETAPPEGVEKGLGGYDFEIIIHNFTVKNGFNAGVSSTAVCRGAIKKWGDEWKVLMPSSLKFTLNGEKLGLM